MVKGRVSIHRAQMWPTSNNERQGLIELRVICTTAVDVVGEVDSPIMWSHSTSMEPNIKGQKQLLNWAILQG
jgi:hypothetical protein